MTQLLEDHLAAVKEALQGVARRRCLSRDFAEEFSSWAIVKFVCRDGAILRQFRGESSLRQYLRVVTDRLFCDYLISLKGKWRPSAKATSLGPVAVSLEKLVYLKGFEPSAAVATVRSRFPDMSESRLTEIFQKLPQREKRSYTDLGALPEIPAGSGFRPDAEIRQREINHLNEKLHVALAKAMSRLPLEDRRILALRFCDGMKITDVGEHIGGCTKKLYRRYSQLFKTLRRELEADGFSSGDVVVLTGAGSLLTSLPVAPFRAEGAFADRGAA